MYENINKAIDAIKTVSLSKGPPIYYRGQNKDYHITSSIHRLSSDEKIESEATKTHAFIRWIKERNALLPSVVAANYLLHETDLVYWAIAQHYGYKTDLIDFTTSLEIATAFSSLGRTVGNTGVIYCLWEDDIQDLTCMYLCADSSFNSSSRELLAAVNYNPFFAFQINELSRITNQHGLFLWDLNAIISSYWNQKVMNDQEWVDSHCFYFCQTSDNIDVRILRTVYPEPNYVELLIDQYVQVENDFSTLQSIFYHEGKIFYPHDGMETSSIDIDFSVVSWLEDDTNALHFVKSWMQHLSNDKYVIFTSQNPVVKLYAELINEVLALKGVFPQFADIGLRIILQKVIGSDNTTSSEVLPLQFVNDLTPDYRKRLLEKLQSLYEQGLLNETQIEISKSGATKRIPYDKKTITLKELFNYVPTPTVLFDDRDMLNIMLHCFIPWQIVMCPKRSRLYNPLEYKEIRLLESENIPNSKVYYWEGAYVILTDKQGD